MTQTEQPTLERITRIATAHINPGDIIVMESDRKLTLQQAQDLMAQIQEYFPNHKVMILPPELHLGIAHTRDNP